MASVVGKNQKRMVSTTQVKKLIKERGSSQLCQMLMRHWFWELTIDFGNMEAIGNLDNGLLEIKAWMDYFIKEWEVKIIISPYEFSCEGVRKSGVLAGRDLGSRKGDLILNI